MTMSFTSKTNVLRKNLDYISRTKLHQHNESFAYNYTGAHGVLWYQKTQVITNYIKFISEKHQRNKCIAVSS